MKIRTEKGNKTEQGVTGEDTGTRVYAHMCGRGRGRRRTQQEGTVCWHYLLIRYTQKLLAAQPMSKASSHTAALSSQIFPGLKRRTGLSTYHMDTHEVQVNFGSFFRDQALRIKQSAGSLRQGVANTVHMAGQMLKPGLRKSLGLEASSGPGSLLATCFDPEAGRIGRPSGQQSRQTRSHHRHCHQLHR
jgi:hypothetical protein